MQENIGSESIKPEINTHTLLADAKVAFVWVMGVESMPSSTAASSGAFGIV